MNTRLQCPACGNVTDIGPERLRSGPIFCSRCGKQLPTDAAPTNLAPPTASGNPMAVASLVVGLVGCVLPLLVPGILGVIFGILGIRKAPRVGGRGLAVAIIGLVFSAIGLIVSPLMVVILLPSLYRARETANRIECASRMRSIALSAAQYARQNGGQYPDTLGTLLSKDPAIGSDLLCPDADSSAAPGQVSVQPPQVNGKPCSFFYVGGRLTSQSGSQEIVLYEPLANHNNDGSNMVFADSHVEFIPVAQARPIIQRLESIQSAQNP